LETFDNVPISDTKVSFGNLAREPGDQKCEMPAVAGPKPVTLERGDVPKLVGFSLFRRHFVAEPATAAGYPRRSHLEPGLTVAAANADWPHLCGRFF
jgi:hypothetical protein